MYSNLLRKNVGVFLGQPFSTIVIVSYFSLFLGLTGSWIDFLIMIKVSGVFFTLLLRGIRCWSGVTLDKLYLFPDKTETLKLSLQISISEGFSILVLLLDKTVIEIDLYLATVFTVFYLSVLWVDLDLSNDLTLSDLLLLGVSTVLLDAYDFSVLLNVSIFFFEIRGVMASFTKLVFPPLCFSTILVVSSLIILSLVLANDFWFHPNPHFYF